MCQYFASIKGIQGWCVAILTKKSCIKVIDMKMIFLTK